MRYKTLHLRLQDSSKRICLKKNYYVCPNLFVHRELTVNSNVLMHSNLVIDNDLDVRNMAKVKNSMILTEGANLDRCDHPY